MQLVMQVSVSEFANTKSIATAKFCRHTVTPGMFLQSFSTVCSQGQEPRVLDGWRGSKRVPPSAQCELSCKTIQQLESKNRQDWLEHQSSDSQTWPYPSSSGASVSESPD